MTRKGERFIDIHFYTLETSSGPTGWREYQRNPRSVESDKKLTDLSSAQRSFVGKVAADRGSVP